MEWLSRIRSHIIKIALHCGLPAMAVRHAHELLRDMKENGNVQVLIKINYLIHVWFIRDKEIIDQQGKSYYFIIFIFE